MAERHIKKIERASCPHPCPASGPDPTWLVPYQGDNALTHHHHETESEDHSTCGPVAFCCETSALAFKERYPKNPEAHAKWIPTSAQQIISWIDAGIPAVYFIFCAAHETDTLLVAGLSGDLARQALLKTRSLEEFSSQARVLADTGLQRDQPVSILPQGDAPDEDIGAQGWDGHFQGPDPGPALGRDES